MFSFTRRALNELEERVATLERVTKRLQMEWADTLESLRQRLARTVRAANRLEALERSPNADVEAAGVEPPPSTLDPVSERILARRRRLSVHRSEEVEQ